MSDIIIPGVGSLEPAPALDNLNLLAPPVAAALTALAEHGVATASSALVVAIDPELADTEVMTREFGMDLALSSNCILVAGKRGLRRSKLFVTGEVLAALPGAEIVEGLGV